MINELESEININELRRLLHDLKLPLTVIQSISDIMHKLNAQEELENYIFVLDRNITYMSRIANSIKDSLEKLDNEDKGIFVTDIVGYTEMLLESVHSVAEVFGINIILYSDFDYMEVRINWRHYERIILNVLQNSLKHAKDCKFINVSLKYIDENIKIIITDDGKNDGDNYYDKSFENSSGEGLYIITSLAKKINAELEHYFSENGMYFSLEFSDVEILTPIDQLEIEDLM